MFGIFTYNAHTAENVGIFACSCPNCNTKIIIWRIDFEWYLLV